MGFYGVLLKTMYLKFREGVMHSAIYALAILSGMQMLWVSIEVWPQVLTVFSFAFVTILLGKTVFHLRAAGHAFRSSHNFASER